MGNHPAEHAVPSVPSSRVVHPAGLRWLHHARGAPGRGLGRRAGAGTPPVAARAGRRRGARDLVILGEPPVRRPGTSGDRHLRSAGHSDPERDRRGDRGQGDARPRRPYRHGPRAGEATGTTTPIWEDLGRRRSASRSTRERSSATWATPATPPSTPRTSTTASMRLPGVPSIRIRSWRSGQTSFTAAR